LFLGELGVCYWESIVFRSQILRPLKEFVQQVLAEHDRAEKMRQAIAHADFTVSALAMSASFRRKGTRRALFWEFAVDKFIELSQGDPGLHVQEHYDTVSFIFDQEVLVRFKKADMGLHSSNYPTPTADLFHEHSTDLFGFSGLQRVEAVYVPNQFDTGILWTGVVAREGHRELWHLELNAPIVAATATLPAPATTSADDLATVKNQAKNADRKQDDHGQG
jgi:hypothetical protein